MRIGIQTWGSDGDILPFLALAGGLRSAGHEVTLAYTSIDDKDYTPLGAQLGVRLIRARGSFDAEPEKVAAEIARTRNPARELVLVLKHFFDTAAERMYRASEELCTGSDLVIGHMMTHTLLTASEKHRRPRASVALVPQVIRTGSAPLFGPNLGKRLNLLSWDLADFVLRETSCLSAAGIRAAAGLRPIRSLQKELFISKRLTLLATSPSITKRRPDWGEHIQICGFLDSPVHGESWTMPGKLRAFLDEGDPPVYMTFGSLTQFDLENTTSLLTEAAGLSGQRTIIQSDWERLPHIEDNPRIFRIGRVPHGEIFPRCAAVVHHGGSGTTQAALLAGCPSVAVAHAFDQPYWAKTLQQLGAAGKPLHRRSVTAGKIARQIEEVAHSSRIREKARLISASMKEEDGVQHAVRLIEERFSRRRGGRSPQRP